ncbi:MAG TPA: RNA methyltransferase [Anaerolineae bacterium]|nr:RNA methyltransferase [Anaerolineae bacterium]
MPEQILITSRQNPRIVAARRLAERKHRRQQGRFLVEGVKLLELALRAGARPRAVFVCFQELAPDAEGLLTRLHAAGAELLPVSPAVMQALAEREAAEGLVATFDLFKAGLDDLSLAGDDLVVVLDRLQDPGNLGTLLRTADAVDAAGVVLLEPCVDPFDPKVVRGSMGSIFHVPLVRTGDVAAMLAALHGRGLRIVAADAHRGVDWGDGLWQGGVALVLGNEARGLSADVLPHIDAWARLPIPGQAESLNVAVAGGVLMYAWLREVLNSSQRRRGGRG